VTVLKTSLGIEKTVVKSGTWNWHSDGFGYPNKMSMKALKSFRQLPIFSKPDSASTTVVIGADVTTCNLLLSITKISL
jgi:hypothetical protein